MPDQLIPLFTPRFRVVFPLHCRYADRAKAIKIKATKNEEQSQLRKLNEEVEELRRRLQLAVRGTRFSNEIATILPLQPSSWKQVLSHSLILLFFPVTCKLPLEPCSNKTPAKLRQRNSKKSAFRESAPKLYRGIACG